MAYCVFPNGDPGELGFGFCGKPTLPDRPYCAHHCRIAYIGHHERKRRLSEIEIEVTFALRRMRAGANLTAEQLAYAARTWKLGITEATPTPPTEQPAAQ